MKTQGHGKTHTQHICKWTIQFLHPLHHLGQVQWIVFHDEDIASKIKLCMVEKFKQEFLRADDLVDLIASLEMQKIFSEKGIYKPSILKLTAICWLQKLD